MLAFPLDAMENCFKRTANDQAFPTSVDGMLRYWIDAAAAAAREGVRAVIRRPMLWLRSRPLGVREISPQKCLQLSLAKSGPPSRRPLSRPDFQI
jgi:hypothetical protein